MTNHHDVIIIGSGAGGGTLGYRLASTGLRVLIVERGDYVPREKANWDSRAVAVDGRHNTRETWRDRDGRPLHLTPITTSGATPSSTARRSSGCVSRISASWPTTAASPPPGRLAMRISSRTYTEAERLYHVHGTRGADPTEPWASAEYAYSTVSHEPRIQQLHDDL